MRIEIGPVRQMSTPTKISSKRPPVRANTLGMPSQHLHENFLAHDPAVAEQETASAQIFSSRLKVPTEPPEPGKAAKSHITRILHLAILLVLLHQLFGSLIMERPLPGEDPAWPYWMHEYVGVVGAGSLTLFWVWTFIRDARETPLGQLFPWLSRRRLKAILDEMFDALQVVRNGGAKDLEVDRTASAFHGLGLLTATFIAFTGAAWFFLLRGTPYARDALGLHKLVANVMWGYIVLHAGAALLHQWLGQDLFSRMFWFHRRQV